VTFSISRQQQHLARAPLYIKKQNKTKMLKIFFCESHQSLLHPCFSKEGNSGFTLIFVVL
jgi:hypothetical protein